MAHILYVNPTAAHGGAEEVLLQVMSVARELGYHPVLVVPREGWLTGQCAAQKIPYELLPTLPDAFTNESWQQQFRPWPRNAMAIARLARKWGAVLVHSNTPRASYHGGLGARLARIPAVTHVHDIVSLPYAAPFKARLLASLADRTLVISKAVEHAILNHAPGLGSQIQVLYNSMDPAVYDGIEAADLGSLFNIPAGTFVVGNVSAMTPWKGQDLLITAFSELRARFPNTRLLIVGGPQGNRQQAEYEAQLHQQVAAYGLEGVVKFTGWREDVLPLIRSFDLFVHMPTLPEPFGLVVLHACALSRPIIAADAGGIPELLDGGAAGVLVPPGDVEALRGAMQSLMEDAQLRHLLGTRARDHFLQRFTRRQMVEGLDYAYRQCLS